jgi:hypothetical protein
VPDCPAVDPCTNGQTCRSAAPGASVYTCECPGGHDQPGDFGWWDSNFSDRVALTIDNSASGADLHDGSNILVEIDHAAWVAAGQSQEYGSDVRIVHSVPLAGSSTPDFTEVERGTHFFLSKGWNLSDTTLFFSTLHAIPAGGINNEYWIYYNAAATPSTTVTDPPFYYDAIRNDWARDSNGNLIGLRCNRLVNSSNQSTGIYIDPIDHTGDDIPDADILVPEQDVALRFRPFNWAPYSIQLRQTGTYDYEVYVHDNMWAIDDDSYATITITDSVGTVLHTLNYGSYANGGGWCFFDQCLLSEGASCCGDHVETIQIDEPNGFSVTIESRGILASARSFGCQTYATWSELMIPHPTRPEDGIALTNGYYNRGDLALEDEPGEVCTVDGDCVQSTGVVSFGEHNSLSTWAGSSCVIPEGPAAEMEPTWCRAHSPPGANTFHYEMDSSFHGVTATTCQY